MPHLYSVREQIVIKWSVVSLLGAL